MSDYRAEQAAARRRMTKLVTLLGVLAMVMFFGTCWAYPNYNVWQKELRGKAALREAEWNRQITIKEAEAQEQAAVALAQAEIARARGVASANEIIGQSLQGNEAYLRYLWIQALQDESNSVIYVPTEAQLPILEATRNVR